MNNERGFILPIILIIATSIFMLTSYILDQYVSDKHFYKEAEEKLMADHLLRLAVHDLEREWSLTEVQKVTSGIIFYPKGDVYYEVSTQDKTQAFVILYASTLHERKAMIVIQYDKSIHRVVRWIEN